MPRPSAGVAGLSQRAFSKASLPALAVMMAAGDVVGTDYPVDEKTIGDKLKKAATIIEVMKRRKADEARAKGLHVAS